jgi:DNA-directed RNA polymerase subunit RPC12/RpoP
MNAENNKPKTIHTIEVNFTPKVTRRQWLDEETSQHVSCTLCGTSLIFKHKVAHVEQTVHEEANCPSCRIRSRQSTHSLQ